MAAPGEPPTSTQKEPDASPQQTADATVPDRIPLPPPAAVPPQSPPRRRRSWADALLVLLVVGFGFIAASTPGATATCGCTWPPAVPSSTASITSASIPSRRAPNTFTG